MENCFFVFAKIICALHYIVAAVQPQIASMNFAQCMRKRFRLRKSFNANMYSITMIKHS